MRLSSLNRNERIGMGEQGRFKWRRLLQIDLQRAPKSEIRLPRYIIYFCGTARKAVAIQSGFD